MRRPDVSSINCFRDSLSFKDPVECLYQRILKQFYYDKNGGWSNETEDLKKLSDEARLVFYISIFEREIMNGGFDQFFFNSSGRYTYDTIESLGRLGATYSHRLLERAVHIHPNKWVLKEEHRVIVSPEVQNGWAALDDEFMSAREHQGSDLPEDEAQHLMRLLLKFIESNPEALVQQ